MLLQLHKSDDLKVHFNPEITPQTDRNSLQVDRWLGGLTSAFDNNRRSLVFPPSIESSQSSSPPSPDRHSSNKKCHFGLE